MICYRNIGGKDGVKLWCVCLEVKQGGWETLEKKKKKNIFLEYVWLGKKERK